LRQELLDVGPIGSLLRGARQPRQSLVISLQSGVDRAKVVEHVHIVRPQLERGLQDFVCPRLMARVRGRQAQVIEHVKICP
jgi:hypothetical protein